MKKLRLHRRFTKLVILVVSMLLMVELVRSSWRLWKKQDIVAERQGELAEVEAENRELTRQLEEAKTEGFVERVAREKLGLVKEGETIVVMPNAKFQMPNEEEKGAELPNWKRWWGLFF